MNNKSNLEGIVIDTMIHSPRGAKCRKCHRKIEYHERCRARKEGGQWVFYHKRCLRKR